MTGPGPFGLHPGLAAAGTWLVARLAALGVLALLVAPRGVSLAGYLGTKYDAGWYGSVARYGYQQFDPEVATNLAFFPLLPWLMRALATVTPLEVAAAGLVISLLAGAAAAWAMGLIARQLAPAAGWCPGLLLVTVWAWLPHGTVESMAYTETLFTALAAWALWAVLAGRLVTAGLLTAVAGLSRPSAAALIAVVGLACLIALVKALRAGDRAERRAAWRPLLGGLVSPLGLLGFVAFVGHRVGRWDGYFEVQRLWGTTFDGGRWTLGAIKDVLTGAQSPGDYQVVTLVLAAAVVLAVLSLVGPGRQPWPLWAFSLLLLVLAIGPAHYFNARGRFLLPAFALLWPVTVGLDRLRRKRWAGVAAVALILVGLAVGCTAFGYYLVVDWPWSP